MKARLGERLFAKALDGILIWGCLQFLPFFLGSFCALLYSFLADGTPWKGWEGQSIGKKLLGLQVMHTVSHRPARWKDSVIRNAPLGIVTFFAVIPLWGWFLFIVIGIPLIAMEVYLMVRVETGHRLGDVMADTAVIEKQAS